MDLGPADNTVTLRSDMRSPSGAILLAVLGIAAPEGGGRSDLEAVPNPVIHSCQVLDPGRDVRRIEVVSEVLKRGPPDGLQPLAHRRRRRAGPGARADPGPGRQPRHAARRAREDAGGADRRRGRPRPAAAVAGLRARARRPDGHWALPVLSSEVASPDAALHLGPQFVLLETAAFDLAAEAIGPTAEPATIGWRRSPRTSCSSPAARSARSAPMRRRSRDPTACTAVRIVLHDEGDGDRAVTAASYQFRVGD